MLTHEYFMIAEAKYRLNELLNDSVVARTPNKSEQFFNSRLFNPSFFSFGKVFGKREKENIIASQHQCNACCA